MQNSIKLSKKKIFVGIDVHRRSYAVCAVSEGVVMKRTVMLAKPEILLGFLRKRFEDYEVHTAYEAGFSGFGLHRFLTGNGVNNIVVNPGSIQTASRDRVKTDRLDAKKVSAQLAAGMLRGIRIPSEEEEAKRLLTRTREQFVRARSRIMNQITMKLYQFSLLDPTYKRALGIRYVRELLASMKMSPQLHLCIECLLESWQAVNDKLKKLQKEIGKQAADDVLEELYRSIPGFGPLTARIVSNELGDMSQFSNERKLSSFIGLTPSEYSSGEHERKGHITRQGNSRLRHVLIEAAWRAITEDFGLKKIFRRIERRAGKKRAIVAIARKLIGRARAVALTRTPYQLKLAA